MSIIRDPLEPSRSHANRAANYPQASRSNAAPAQLISHRVEFGEQQTRLAAMRPSRRPTEAETEAGAETKTKTEAIMSSAALEV